MPGTAELTLPPLGFLEVFSLYISEITTLSIFADCVHSIRFVKAILIYTMNPWVLVGCGGLGRAEFCVFIFQIFRFRVFEGDL